MKKSSRSRIPALFSAFLFLVGASGGCSTSSTVQPKPSITETGHMKGSVRESGFLGDYSQLKPGNEGQAALVYVNPSAQWSKYGKVILEPVQFWASADAQTDPSDQQMLAGYFYNVLKENLQKQFTLVDQPGEDVMKIQAAITDATSSTPMLRSVSVIVPQARLLNKAQSLATGSYAFVGSAQAEGQFLDSMTGERLAAAVDKRSGGLGLKAAAQWKWGDAQNAMDYWAQAMVRRIVDLRSTGGIKNP